MPKSPLHFTHVPVSEDSRLHFEIPVDARRGIYMYVFSDGMRYVGLSDDMADRYTQHLHEYEKDPAFKGVTVTDVYFAPLENQRASRAYLRQAEKEAITWAEEQGWSLKNKVDANKPGGNGGFEIKLFVDQEALSLPWSRADMTHKHLQPVGLGVRKKTYRQRYKKVKELPFYDELTKAVAKYISRTIPEPAATVNTLWTITVFPKSSPKGIKRLATLTCGTVETLVMYLNEDGQDIHGFINTKRPEGDKGFKPKLLSRLPYTYRGAKDVVCYEFDSAEMLDRALDNERFLDWCYRLNVELMRKGGCPCGKFGNPFFEADILAHI